MRTKLLLSVIVIAGLALSWLIVGDRDRPPISTTGLPLAIDGPDCPGGETGADIHWIRGTGFPTPEAALGAAEPSVGALNPSRFSKRYVRLGHGENAGLGAEFTLVTASGDPSAWAIAFWSEDGWLVHNVSRCVDDLEPESSG